MSAAHDIAGARALFEKAERETRPELKAHALEEAVTLLASIDPDEVSDAEGKLVANLRMAHTRRLLAQLVGLTSVSMDDWFDYIGLLLGELSPDVERVTQADAQLKENYERFLGLWGAQIAGILEKQRHNAP
jgi:hypothetical protein